MTLTEYLAAMAAVRLTLFRFTAPLFGLLHGRPSNDEWSAFIQALYPSVYRARMDAYRATERFYAATRAAQTGRTDLPRVLPRNYAPEALDEAMREHLKPVIDALPKGSQVPQDTITSAVATAQRHAQNAGRQAIVDAARHDPEARGYARVAVGETCAFCIMLTSRGPVYKSASSALLRDGGDEPYHDNCNCAVVPVFDRDNWPGKETFEAARRAWVQGDGTLKGLRDLLDKQNLETDAA